MVMQHSTPRTSSSVHRAWAFVLAATLLAAVYLVAHVARPAHAACDDGRLYAVVHDERTPAWFVAHVDPVTTFTETFSLPFALVAVARDPAQCSDLYLVGRDGGTGSTDALYRLVLGSSDPLQRVGSTELAADSIDGLGFHPDGTLYALQASRVYTISIASGSASLIGEIATGDTERGGDLAFAGDGTMYVARKKSVYMISDLADPTFAGAIRCDCPIGGDFSGLGVDSSGTFHASVLMTSANVIYALTDDPGNPCPDPDLAESGYPRTLDITDVASAHPPDTTTATTIIDVRGTGIEQAVALFGLALLVLLTICMLTRRRW